MLVTALLSTLVSLTRPRSSYCASQLLPKKGHPSFLGKKLPPAARRCEGTSKVLQEWWGNEREGAPEDSSKPPNCGPATTWV